jgi:hypothetical protein
VEIYRLGLQVLRGIEGLSLLAHSILERDDITFSEMNLIVSQVRGVILHDTLSPCGETILTFSITHKSAPCALREIEVHRFLRERPVT